MPTADLRPVTTYKQAIKALGGTAKAARALNRPPTQICKWRTRHGAFPSDLYFVVQAALERTGHKADPRVFTFEMR